MQQALLDHLRVVTEEEQRILDGVAEVDKDLYTSGKDFTVDSAKMLSEGKLIAVRTHTRFVHFPSHRHNYIEVLYVCQGQLTNIIGGKEVVIHAGELLFLNQYTRHEILPAGEEDIAINFMILPEFFDVAYTMAGNNNVLADFLVNVLRQDEERGEYLHFKVAEVLPVQNLLENLIWTIVNKQPNKRSINQATMGLLFLQLMNHMDKMETDAASEQQKFIIQVLSYVEEHYKSGELTELAEELHFDIYWLSKEIRKRTGKTYTDLVQAKRLSQAAYLLRTTAMNVMDISMAVGYDNISYFHRIFQKKYGMTPRRYRISE